MLNLNVSISQYIPTDLNKLLKIFEVFEEATSWTLFSSLTKKILQVCASHKATSNRTKYATAHTMRSDHHLPLPSDEHKGTLDSNQPIVS
jgi:hypothetical protein